MKSYPSVGVGWKANSAESPSPGDQPKRSTVGEVVYLSSTADLLREQHRRHGDAKLLISIWPGSTIAECRRQPAPTWWFGRCPILGLRLARDSLPDGTEGVTEDERALVSQLLDTMGEQLYVADESAIDKITAVSGSGPAYVFLVIEAMINAAVNIGLRPDDARRMVLQTVTGSSEFASQSGQHPAVLKDMVTSPGGTTAAGLRVLEQQGVRAAFIDAVAAAHQRAEELGRQ